jgi:hypothetical protein
MKIITQLELDLGINITPTTITTSTTIKEKGKIGSDENTVVTNNTSKNVNKEKKESKEKWKNTGPLFDETGCRILARRPRFEKDYQKDLVFYLTKLCQYLPWRVYIEFEVNFEGKQGFIDLVLKTERPQHWLIELKKGTITIETIRSVLDKNYIQGYKNQIPNGKYPLLYIIGQKVSTEIDDYIDLINEDMKQQFKRCKYKPQIFVRTYTELMAFLDGQLSQTEIGHFEFQRIQRDVPLLYEFIR